MHLYWTAIQISRALVNDNPPVFDRPTYETQITEEDDRNLPKRVLQVIVWSLSSKSRRNWSKSRWNWSQSMDFVEKSKVFDLFGTKLDISVGFCCWFQPNYQFVLFFCDFLLVKSFSMSSESAILVPPSCSKFPFIFYFSFENFFVQNFSFLWVVLSWNFLQSCCLDRSFDEM